MLRVFSSIKCRLLWSISWRNLISLLKFLLTSHLKITRNHLNFCWVYFNFFILKSSCLLLKILDFNQFIGIHSPLRTVSKSIITIICFLLIFLLFLTPTLFEKIDELFALAERASIISFSGRFIFWNRFLHFLWWIWFAAKFASSILVFSVLIASF